jgi:hypothetical protein
MTLKGRKAVQSNAPPKELSKQTNKQTNKRHVIQRSSLLRLLYKASNLKSMQLIEVIWQS